MTLTTAQQVRLRIQDLPLVADVTRHGDGTATVFQLEHRNVTSATAYVPGATGWTATGATVDPSGFVTFSGVISAGSAFRVRYVHSVFSDDEIGHMTAVGGGVAGAALEACKTLMFDSLKRAAWGAPDGTTYDDTKAMVQLTALYGQLTDELAGQALSEGTFAAWSLGQADW